MNIYKKILFLFIFLMFSFFISGNISFAKNISFEQVQFQSTEYQKIENNILKIKGNNPAILIPINESSKNNEVLKINFGEENKITDNKILITFNRSDVQFNQPIQKIIDIKENPKNITLNFKQLPYFEGNISYLAVLFFSNEEVAIKEISLNKMTISNYFYLGIKEAFAYVPFSPRTINFLEGPIWHGDYINKPIVKILFWSFLISFLVYLFNKEDKNLKLKLINFNIFLIIFFWISLDIMHTTNQIKMVYHTTSAEDIMDNSRMGKLSTTPDANFIEFLDFIKQNTKNKAKAFYVGNYPYSFEAQYHLYPDLKFDTLEKADYVIDYSQGFYGYTPPIYDETNKKLTTLEFINNENIEKTVNIENKITFKNNIGSIYKIAK